MVGVFLVVFLYCVILFILGGFVYIWLCDVDVYDTLRSVMIGLDICSDIGHVEWHDGYIGGLASVDILLIYDDWRWLDICCIYLSGHGIERDK